MTATVTRREAIYLGVQAVAKVFNLITNELQ